MPEASGTSDAVILREDGELHVCDLKFGRGVKVDTKDPTRSGRVRLIAKQRATNVVACCT
ncbi:DUF2800 domain-containing protein [Bordetella bronchiseptica]|uniref:DUF2800 domain-containing protein n=1 Tax=Bordetella bronchiseptica TaxID=518 RepID=UPI003996516C